jgi:hypothetical protein
MNITGPVSGAEAGMDDPVNLEPTPLDDEPEKRVSRILVAPP